MLLYLVPLSGFQSLLGCNTRPRVFFLTEHSSRLWKALLCSKTQEIRDTTIILTLTKDFNHDSYPTQIHKIKSCLLSLVKYTRQISLKHGPARLLSCAVDPT